MNKMMKKIFSVVPLIMIVILIFIFGHMINSVESLEERLQYIEPQLSKMSEVQVSSGSDVKVNTSQVDLPSGSKLDIQYTYVPSYSHVYRNNGQPLLLESTLSIRNTDPLNPLNIHSVEYYNSKGVLLRSYVDTPLLLGELSSVEYLNEKMDSEGGFGAFFVVLWSSENILADPIIESVLIESTTQKQISFISKGKTLPFEFRKK